MQLCRLCMPAARRAPGVQVSSHALPTVPGLAPQHQGDAPDVPDEASVSSSDAGSESPTAAARGNGALRTQSAETMAVADAMAKVAEVRACSLHNLAQQWRRPPKPLRILGAHASKLRSIKGACGNAK